MIDAFIDLDTSVKLMLTSRNHVILYDTLPYNGELLDKLYKILSSFNPASVIVVTHAVYDTDIYKDSYNIWSEQVGNYIYHGAISQLDVNKLMCVFSAAKITDIKFYDKMYMYQYYLEEQQCIIDSNNGMYLIVAKKNGLASINYAKRNMIDQVLLQVCRKNSIRDIKNFNNFIDYDCVRWFENYGSVLELPIYVQMTVFGFFKFIKPEVSFDIDKIKFNSKLETVDYSNINKVQKVTAKPQVIEDIVIVNQNHSNENVTMTKPVKTSKADNKNYQSISTSKRRADNVLLTVLILLLLISVGIAFGVNYYYKQQSSEASQELLLAYDDLGHKQLYLSKIQESVPSEYAGILDTLNNMHPDYAVVGSVTMDNTIEVMYYMLDGNTTDELVEMLSQKFNVNAIVDGGIITLNDQNYKKFSISLSKQQ